MHLDHEMSSDGDTPSFLLSPSDVFPVATGMTFCPASAQSKCQFSGPEKARHPNGPGICRIASQSVVSFMLCTWILVSMDNAVLKTRLLSRSRMPWTVALVSRCDREPRALLSCSAPTGRHLSTSRLWPAERWTAWRRWRNVGWEGEDRELVIGMLCLCVIRQKLSVGWEEAGRREEKMDDDNKEWAAWSYFCYKKDLRPETITRT